MKGKNKYVEIMEEEDYINQTTGLLLEPIEFNNNNIFLLLLFVCTYIKR